MSLKEDLSVRADSFTGAFSNLNCEFGPAPFWCWTGRMTKASILKQLRDMRRKGINEFFIIAVYGLERPSFLRESYWDYIAFTLEHCRKLGMKAWFYDDLNWPSGTAAGYLLRDHPEYRSSPIVLRQIGVNPWDTIGEGLAEACSRLSSEGEVLFTGFRDSSGRIISIEEALSLSSSGELVWEKRRPGNACLVALVRKPIDSVLLTSVGTADSWGQHGYGDLLSRDSVRAWMSYIHDEYAARFREYLGSTVRGFFFDEPYANINHSPGFAWTEDLFKVFESRHGYRLQDNFPLLLSESFDDAAVKVRIDYYSTLTELFSTNFSGTIADWCQEHGLASTGHCMAEEELSFSNKISGDIHECLKPMQVPGMDFLSGWMSDRDYWISQGRPMNAYCHGMVHTAKRVTGTARYSGAARTMCEAFGVRSWNCSLQDQKQDNDWLASMGISLVNDNNVISSITDFRKRASSGKNFFQPWWSYYKLYADYCRRVSLFAAYAPLDAHVAVLYSRTSSHAVTSAGGASSSGRTAEAGRGYLMVDMLNASMETLFEQHVDFEVLFEDVLGTASVSGGVLSCSNAEFRAVIVPGCHVIDSACTGKLDEFAASGGRVIWLGCAPGRRYDGKALSPYNPHKDSLLIVPESADSACLALLFAQHLLPFIPVNWLIEDEDGGGGMWAVARSRGGEYMIFISNHSGGNRRFTLKHKLAGTAEVMDVDDGGRYSAESVKEGEWSSVDLSLALGQSFIVNIRQDGEDAASLPPFSRLAASNFTGSRILLDSGWDFSVEGDNHFMPFLHVKPDPHFRGEDELWHDSPLDNSWMEAPYGKLFDGFTSEEAPYYWVRGSFTLGFMPERLSLLVDNKDWQRLYINGKKVLKSSKGGLWDSENRVFDVSGLCREGCNDFSFLVKSSYWRSVKKQMPSVKKKDFIDPVVVCGDFMVGPEDEGPVLLPACGRAGIEGWTQSGYPHFAGTGVYRQEVELDAPPAEARLVMESAFAAAEVVVNGRHAGTRAWRPYVFDISGLLKEGANTIEVRVANALGNILRHSYGRDFNKEQAGGITGPVYILSDKAC